MREHPIQDLMKTAMDSIKQMVDVNTIVGDEIRTQSGVVIIPISKVTFGFGAGGTEFDTMNKCKKEEKVDDEYPFGGGSGAAVKINPIGFIVVDSKDITVPKFVPVDHSDAIDKLLDYVPDLMERFNKIFNNLLEKRKEKSNDNDDVVITHKEIHHEQ